jgi:hypothetical protein
VTHKFLPKYLRLSRKHRSFGSKTPAQHGRLRGLVALLVGLAVAFAALSITVAAATALSITTTALNPPTATVGVGYAAQQAVAATGGTTPYSWSASGLPSGMGINSSSGAVFGTPTVAGTFNFTVTVTDSSSPQQTASKVLSLTVAAATPTLSITTTALNPATATVGVGYAAQQAVTATGGTTPYSWSVSGQPGGMGINSSSGAVFGTPTVAGTFSLTVTVADSSSPQQTASKVLSLTVAAATPTTGLRIAGQVTSGSTGLDGVTVAISGQQNSITTTSGGGTYSFTGLPSGNYTATPSRTGCSFTPTSYTYAPLSADRTTENFTASCSTATQQLTLDVSPTGSQTAVPGQVVSFSLAVTSGGAPESAATIPLTDNLTNTNKSIVSANDGSASYVTSASKPGSYTVTFGPATKQGYSNSGSLSRTVVVSGCSVTLNTTNVPAGVAGGTYTIPVIAANGCTWNATSDSSWATIISGSNGSGNGPVIISVSPNSDATPRLATITIGGGSVTVNQSVCTVDAIAPPSIIVNSPATNGSIVVTAVSGCPWSAASSAPWLTITSGANSTGNGSVGYTVGTNPGDTRSATIGIKNRTFTITQSGTCSYAVSPLSITAGYRGATDVLKLTTGQTCPWTVSSSQPWTTLAPSSGTGPTSIVYTVQQYGGTVARNATINISGQTVQVQQAGNTAMNCTPTISSVQPAYSGFFLPLGSIPDRFDVTVGWCGKLQVRSALISMVRMLRLWLAPDLWFPTPSTWRRIFPHNSLRPC